MKMITHRLSSLVLSMTLLVTATAAPTGTSQLKYDASEGGWVDKKNNLVWGYDPYYLETHSPGGSTGFPTAIPVDFVDAELMAEDYPQFLWDNGWSDYAMVAAYWEAHGLLWRLPTIQEAQRAARQGLFKLGQYSLDPRFSLFWTSSATADGSGVYLMNEGGGLEIEAPSTPAGLPLFVRPYR